jgi:hypothetical protein
MPTALVDDRAASGWPTAAFEEIPALEVAQVVAAGIRARAAAPDARVDVGAVARAAGATVRTADMGAGRGGRQGLLVPRPDDRFTITVDATPRGGWDPDLDATRRSAIARRRGRFLAVHELAHILFYRRRRGEVPRRAPVHAGEREEAFCDEFARALLISPSSVAADAGAIVTAAERFDVSLELAARTAAQATGARVTLWRWDPPVTGSRAALHVQWASDRGHGEDLGVRAYRTDPRDLPAVLARGASSAIVLRALRQALAVNF